MKTKRIISVILTIAMITILFIPSSFAVDGGASGAPVAESPTPSAEPAAGPADTPTVDEPTATPVTEPTTGSAPEISEEPTPSPSVEPFIEPTPVPTAEPTVEPTLEPAAAGLVNEVQAAAFAEGPALLAAATTYTVTYNANYATSGTVPTDSNTYKTGDKVAVQGNSGNLLRTNYRFVGWNTNINGGESTEYGPGRSTYTMGSRNVTFYAMWKSTTTKYDHIDVRLNGSITIDYKINGISQPGYPKTLNVTTSGATGTYTVGGSTYAIGNFNYSNTDGGEWRYTTNSTNRFYWPDSVTLNATLSDGRNSYPFSHTFTGNEILAAYIACPMDTGFDFILNSSDITDQIAHDLTFKTSSGGTVGGGSANIVYSDILDGSDCPTPPATSANAGYHFLGWTKNSDTTLYTTDQVDAMTITADTVFTARYGSEFRAHNSNGPGGDHGYIAVTYRGATVNLDAGQTETFVYYAPAGDVSIDFVPDANYAFKYYVIGNGAAHIDADPDEIDPGSYAGQPGANNMISVNPKWVTSATYTLTYDANGGTGAPTDDTLYNGGDEVTVLGPGTMSHSGMVFAGWKDSDGHSYAEGDKFEMPTHNVTLVAQWTASVTFTASGPGSLAGQTTFNGIVPGTSWNSAVAVPAPQPDSGAYFMGWSPAFPSTVTQTQTYTATFAQKTAITLTADSSTVTYNGSLRTVNTFTGLPSGITVTGLTVSGQGTHAGTYNVTFTKNNVKLWSGTQDVTERYNMTYVNGLLTINKAALTVTAADKSMEFGHALPSFTYGSTALQGTDTLAGLSLGITIGSTATTTSPVGTYDITVTGAAQTTNYNVTYTKGTLTITPNSGLSITAVGYSGVYDGAAHAGLTSVSASVTGAALSYSTDGVNYSSDIPEFTNAGDYVVHVKAVLANYNEATATVPVSISKAALAITADDKSMEYGDPLPVYTYSVSSLQGADTLEGLSLGITVGSTATAAAPVGAYDITVTGAAVADNYTITYNKGTLTVTPKTGLSIDAAGYSGVYDGAAHAGVTSVSASVDGAVLSYSMDGVTYGSEIPAFTNAGGYTVHIKATLPNYADAAETVTVSIDKVALTITANNESMEYGSPLPAYTYTHTALVGTETLEELSLGITVGGAATAASPVGTYDITVTGVAETVNYAVIYQNGTLTVTPNTGLSVDAAGYSGVYDGAAHAGVTSVSASVDGAVLSYSMDGVTYSSEIPAVTNAGTYTVHIKATLPNYADAATAVAVSVGKAVLTVTADNKTVTYMDALPTYTVSYSGFAGSEDDSVLGGLLNAGSSYKIGDAAGSYVIKAEGYTSANYEIKYVDGTLTVNSLSFTVTFVDYDGMVLKTEPVPYGATATAPANPNNQTGYHFTGWDKEFGNVTSSFAVTAQYAINTYTVQFFAMDGVTQIGAMQTVNWGTAATAVTAPMRTGYTFDEWVLTGDDAAVMTSLGNVKENIVAVARYVRNGYTVTFVDYDGTELGTDVVSHGNGADAPADPTREGYTFTGWDVPFGNVTSNMTVTAQYAINTYTVTFVDYDGTVLDEQTIDWDTAATAPADPERDGYEFTGWDVPFANVTGDLTVTAVYEAITITAVDEDIPQTADEESVPAGSPQQEDMSWLWWLLLIPLLLLLLLLLLWYNVSVAIYGVDDKGQEKLLRTIRRLKSKKDDVVVSLKKSHIRGGKHGFVELTNPFTKRMRGNRITVDVEGGNILSAVIPDDVEGKFQARIDKWFAL